MLEHCLSQGLNVVAADAVEWLKAQPEGSLSAVTAFHVLEHLPFAALLELVQAAHRALRAGGIAIFETPNPENVLVGSHTFYHDPTHRHPLTPTLLEFVLNYVGFSRVVIERLNPYPPQAKVPGDGTLVERVNGHFYGPQDFAAIGYK
jgi:O-antigen chain-terminating methyltransferase